MYLVCVVQRTAVHVQVLARPRIAAGHADLAVGISPISLAPVGAVVADAGVGDAGRIYIRLAEQQLGHEAAVRCAEAADFRPVDIRMRVAETFGRLDYVVGNHVAGGVDVPGGEFLPETGRTARIYNQEYISLSRVVLRGI